MELVYTSLLILITSRFTCADSEICSTIKNSANCQQIVKKHFILLFMSLLTALMVHILARICLIFLKSVLDQT